MEKNRRVQHGFHWGFWATALAVLLFSGAANAGVPSPIDVLFVANGYYQQETRIYDHLTSLGYNVTIKKDYKINSSTDLTAYELIIITEFAPNITTSGVQRIKNSGIPLLIVEYWDFWYSYRFGLTTTDDCGYVGGVEIETIDPVDAEEILGVYNNGISVYSSSYTIYGIEYSNIKAGVTPIYYSSSNFGEVAVLYDEAHRILSTGVYDTTRYTTQSWMLFDRFLKELIQPTTPWANDGELWVAYEESGLRSYIAEVKRAPQNHTEQEISDTVWRTMFLWHLEPLADFVISELTCPSCLQVATTIGFFFSTFLTSPSDSADHLVRRTRDPLANITPENCGDTTQTEYCSTPVQNDSNALI